ncbi:hypothetical protein IX51_03220 [uncultured archaeon]|nr:hypothetical protein IX51_03220 [uncultured archaeon]HKJ96424.1 ZPR1 zinc finger domain-containing protein [Thermoplasmataceae archaeon]
MDEDEEIPQEFQTNLKCPSCGEDLYLIFYNTQIAYEEGVSIETYYCKSCLFKQSAVAPMERRDPVRTTLKLRSQDDLRVVVYRSTEAVLQIPEIEAEVLPGKSATGEITTVEGILSRILEKLDIIGEDAEDPEKMEKIRNVLEGILNGNAPEMTMIIEDPSGKSRINSSRASRVKLGP